MKKILIKTTPPQEIDIEIEIKNKCHKLKKILK